jgi:voltage-gated potassium channel
VTTASPGPGRRRAAAAAAARSLVSVAFLVTLYYWAPLDQRLDTGVLIWLTVGLIGLSAALAWQVRAILASDTPRLRAAEAAAFGLPFLVLLYAAAYAALSLGDPASFTQPLGRTDALYFAMTVFSTVGFGDITPVTQFARLLTTTQMVVGLIAVGVVAKLLFGAVQVAVNRRAAAAAEDRSAPPARDR